MTAPANLAQFDENVAALQQGPLSEEERELIMKFGDEVHRRKKWFV